MTAEPVRAQIRIDAPPERVWEFFTRPEAIIRWMGNTPYWGHGRAASSLSTSRAPRSAAGTLSWTPRTGCC